MTSVVTANELQKRLHAYTDQHHKFLLSLLIYHTEFFLYLILNLVLVT